MANTARAEDARRAVADAERVLNAAREELQRAESAEQELTPEQLLAIDLHDALCRWNHTDGCGWFYEIKDKTDHQWDRHAHGSYLKKAKELSARFPELNLSLAGEFLRATKGI